MVHSLGSQPGEWHMQLARYIWHTTKVGAVAQDWHDSVMEMHVQLAIKTHQIVNSV